MHFVTFFYSLPLYTIKVPTRRPTLCSPSITISPAKIRIEIERKDQINECVYPKFQKLCILL